MDAVLGGMSNAGRYIIPNVSSLELKIDKVEFTWIITNYSALNREPYKTSLSMPSLLLARQKPNMSAVEVDKLIMNVWHVNIC